MSYIDASDGKTVLSQPRQWTMPRDAVTFAAVDAVVIISVGMASGLIFDLSQSRGGGHVGFLLVSIVVAALFVMLGSQRGLYAPETVRRPVRYLRRLVAVWALAFLFLSAIAFGLKIGMEFSRGFIALFAVGGLITLSVYRALYQSLIGRAEARGLIRRLPAFLIGPEAVVGDRRLRQRLDRAGYDVRQAFAWRGEETDHDVGRAALATLAAVRGSEAEEVLVASSAAGWHELRDILRSQPLPVYLIPEGELADLVRRPVQTAGGLTLVEVQRGPLSHSERRVKRALDVVIASVGLALLLPLLVVVGIAIKLDSPGPILFRQTRHGFNGRKFKILKFRSMSVQEDGATVRQATRDDKRVTPVGRWLRRSSIDELPQLLNVLRGEMSIVGPRPHAIAHDTYYDDLIANYAFRHHVKPGLTGWAQANGYRGETRDLESMAKRVECDIWYVDNCSVALDLRIIILTFFSLVRPRNAY